MRKEFYDKPLYTIPNYILGFMQCSFYFAICNILLILFIIITTIYPNQFNLFMLFICLIPLGPSIGALYSTTSKIIREKDIFFSSYYWNHYKNNFISNLKLWLILLVILTVLFMDFQYFYLNSPEKGIHIFFAALIIICLLLSLYCFPINSRFELKLKDLFLLSIYYMIKKFPITILKASSVGLTLYLSNNISIILLFFMPSILSLLYFYYDRNIFSDIENKYVSSSDNNLKPTLK